MCSTAHQNLSFMRVYIAAKTDYVCTYQDEARSPPHLHSLLHRHETEIRYGVCNLWLCLDQMNTLWTQALTKSVCMRIHEAWAQQVRAQCGVVSDWRRGAAASEYASYSAALHSDVDRARLQHAPRQHGLICLDQHRLHPPVFVAGEVNVIGDSYRIIGSSELDTKAPLELACSSSALALAL